METYDALLLWVLVVCLIYLLIETRPRINKMSNGDIWLFYTYNTKRKAIILWYGKIL